MRQPLISIITPTYNTTSLIVETYNSLLQQTYKNFEWIIIDDASEQNTQKIIEKIVDEKKLNINFIRNKKNSGPSHCRNLGAKSAQGSYLIFVDDDDLIPEQHLDEMVNKLDRTSSNIIPYCKTIPFVKEQQNVKYLSDLSLSFNKDDFDGLEAFSTFLNYPFFNHCGILLERDIFLFHHGYDEKLIVDEDGDLVLRLLLQNYFFVLVEDTSYYYRQHRNRNRLSENNSIDKIKNRLLAMSKIIDRLKEKHLLNRFALDISLRYDNIAVEACSLDTKIAQTIFNKANEVFPNYKSQMRSKKIWLRNIIGCKRYSLLRNFYARLLQR